MVGGGRWQERECVGDHSPGVGVVVDGSEMDARMH